MSGVRLPRSFPCSRLDISSSSRTATVRRSGCSLCRPPPAPRKATYPLDVLDAESEGMVGYLIEQELDNALPSGHLVATLLTQILVDRRDPAFRHPTKPIGPVYDKTQAEQLARARGWSIAEDGKGWRRVVASPQPMQILEARVIELLVSQGVTVICAGGGGIPVLERSDGSLIGVEAVIDKDLASALLARQLRADQLLLLTDVDGVYLNWGTDTAKAIRRAGAGALKPGDFAPGSMGPKIEAANGFAAETGRPASSAVWRTPQPSLQAPPAPELT